MGRSAVPLIQKVCVRVCVFSHVFLFCSVRAHNTWKCNISQVWCGLLLSSALRCPDDGQSAARCISQVKRLENDALRHGCFTST